MRKYQVIVIIAGLFFIGSLCGYIGYIVWKKDHDGFDKPPHIILIVADDLGWNDVSFHGANQIPTPNIDALAYNGVILNRHYTLPTCTPSRMSLMTARYVIRDGMQGFPGGNAQPRVVPLNVTFMPEFLRDLGYETRLLGKWDLGYYTENHTPTHRGFDSFFGYYNGLISYFTKMSNNPMKYGLDRRGYDLRRDGPNSSATPDFNHTQYFTDLITDEAEKIIKNNANKKQLFLEIAHPAPHAAISTETPLEVRNVTENDKNFAYIKDEKRRRYAGVMQALDESVGRVVKALSDADMLKNSIIVFMSDNGASTVGFQANAGSNYPLRGIKDTLLEGGVRSVACVFSPLIKKSQKLSEKFWHITDWLPTLYSAAGGNVSDLGLIDGIDQWPSLVNNLTSPRHEMLLNIDEILGDEAAIVGGYKIIKTSNHSIDGYFGDSGNSPSYPVYNVSEALNSPAGLAISQIPGFFSSTDEEARQLRHSAVVNCQRPNNYSRCAATCLFDIINDPCETQDLSKLRPNDFVTLKKFVDGYRKILVTQTIPMDIDPCSFPQYFNGTWVPWRRDGVNSSTIIPEELCRNKTIGNKNTTIDDAQAHKRKIHKIF